MKWNFLMYIKVLNKHICFTAEKENFAKLLCCKHSWIETKRALEGSNGSLTHYLGRKLFNLLRSPSIFLLFILTFCQI